jgi:hypothetical protein
MIRVSFERLEKFNHIIDSYSNDNRERNCEFCVESEEEDVHFLVLGRIRIPAAATNPSASIGWWSATMAAQKSAQRPMSAARFFMA